MLWKKLLIGLTTTNTVENKMKVSDIIDLRLAIQKTEIKPGIILLASAFIPALHRYIGSFEFAMNNYPEASEFKASVYMFASAFFLLGIIPLLLIKITFKESLSEYGLSFGNLKTGMKYILLIFPLIAVLLLYPSSGTREMLEFYPLDKAAGESGFSFLRYEVIRIVLFYTAWEFFFRGFILFGLRKYMGDWLAICIQTVPSCLWHIGMPAGEIFASIFGGILFGLMAIKSKSILYPFILHVLIGFTLDLLIVLQNYQ